MFFVFKAEGVHNQAFRRLRCFGPPGEKCKEVKKKSRGEEAKLLSYNRSVRKVCLALTGLAVFLSFFLNFQLFFSTFLLQVFSSFYKPRCLVYKNQKDCTNINITLMATLYHTTCSGLIEKYTCVHGKAKPFSQVRASGNGLKHRIPLCMCT